MGSSRLPGKVLADVCGKPALTRLLDRLRVCKRLDGIVLATSTDPKDTVLCEWAKTENIPFYRGSEEDVLLRVLEAQRKMRSEVVVEVWGDMTLLDPELIDLGIEMFLENECHVVTTARKPSFPIGVDVMVFSLKELEWINDHVLDREAREHVSVYFLQHPEKYRILHLLAPQSLQAPNHRFVLDYPEDLQFIRAIYTHLEPVHGSCFGLRTILDLLGRKPELLNMNKPHS